MRRLGALVAIALGALLPGCDGQVAVAPPPVHWGHDVCHLCGMIVSDERFAAAAVIASEPRREVRLYDDLGCLLDDLQGVEPQRVLGAFVRAFDGERWLDARTARYVRSPRIHTPMAYGIAACADDREAASLAAEFEGEALEYATLERRAASGDLGPGP